MKLIFQYLTTELSICFVFILVQLIKLKIGKYATDQTTYSFKTKLSSLSLTVLYCSTHRT